MKQINLYKICNGFLKPGQAYDISAEDLEESSRRERIGLAQLLPATQEEINAFIEKISKNWNVTIVKTLNGYTIHKPVMQELIQQGLGTNISELSGRPGHDGYEKFKSIASSWGYD